MTDNTILWWYASNRQKFGPYTQKQLFRLGREGYIRPTDLVWNQNLDNWVAASSVDGLEIRLQPPALPEQDALMADAAQALEEQLEKQFAQAQTGDLRAQLVGPQYGYYARVWKGMESPRLPLQQQGQEQAEQEQYKQAAQPLSSKISWNWAAFFGGIIWLSYRKMYVHCGVFLAFAIVVGLVVDQVFLKALNLTQKDVETFGMVVELVVRTGFGLFGNYVYKLHIDKKMAEIAASTDNVYEVQNQAQQEGGVNKPLAIGVGVVIAYVLVKQILQQMQQ